MTSSDAARDPARRPRMRKSEAYALPRIEPAQRMRISGHQELIQAVPYLLGFHPRTSLVLVGLRGGQLVVTARLDLADAFVDVPTHRSSDSRADEDAGSGEGTLAATIRAMVAGGSAQFVAISFPDDTDARVDSNNTAVHATDDGFGEGTTTESRRRAGEVAAAVAAAGGDLLEVLEIRRGRWWSLTCSAPDCCPVAGRPLPTAPSQFAAAATLAGVVAFDDRAELGRQLDPVSGPGGGLETLVSQTARERDDSTGDIDAQRWYRSVTRALFAAARASDAAKWVVPDPEVIARLAVALSEVRVRDSVWMAIDGGRLDGRPLWRELGRRAPGAHRAPPLFLFAWASWRKGDGALAGMAAERALAADASYSPADLLLAALSYGMNPHQLPRLRLPRPA